MPGIRTIICEGQVLAYRSENNPYNRPFQALHPFSTQLNTALSKCYISDSLGSRIGLKKGSIYIEDKIIQQLLNVFDCKQHGDYLFLYGEPFLFPVSKYQDINNIYIVRDKDLREQLGNENISWIKLGARINVNHKNLIYTLVEIEAYSPIDEFALFWFDTTRGNMHGLWTDGIVPIDEKGKSLVEEITKKHKEFEIVEEYIKTNPNSR